MANDFRQASFTVKLKNEGEARWLKTIFRHIDALIDNIDNEDIAVAKAYLRSSTIPPEEVEHDGFGWTLVIDQPNAHIYGDGDFVNIDIMGKLLSAFLREHNCREVIAFTYADTCDKPRAGHFGGGCVVCTATSIEYRYTDQIVRELMEKIPPAVIDPICPGDECESNRLQYVCRVYEYHNIEVLYGTGDVDLQSLDDSLSDEDFQDHFYCSLCGDTFDLNRETYAFEKQQ